MTENHVPPKSWSPGRAVRIWSILDSVAQGGLDEFEKRAYGVPFRTLCADCNGNILQPYDRELASLTTQLRQAIGERREAIPFGGSALVRPKRIALGVLAHLCSVGVDRYNEQLSSYVLGVKQSLLDDVKIYYWPYLHSPMTIVRDYRVFNIGSKALSNIFILKAYPVAFAITIGGTSFLEDAGVRDFDAYARIGVDDEAPMHFSLFNMPSQEWPECGDGNSMLAFNSESAFKVTGKLTNADDLVTVWHRPL
ncbi:hypothetical protein [Stenotrophomonas maltophilia]|uniref:hypothetical protein n=1 Tax=Stenotrophomonas maltophilia TaxID=40324 RepID=UPI0011804192|nr:hypothetical protein [Stenotrophomonas maltophilia]